MDIDLRDRATVELVARFNQLSSSQIHTIIFNDAPSRTSLNRTLTRLVEQRHLARIERRLTGGSRGGSGQYVYQLGLQGHKLYREGRYIPATAVNVHSLAIVDAFATLIRLERAGSLRIRGYSTEPDCHVTVGRYELKPDLYAEIERLSRPGGGGLMFEIDMGSQGQRQIMGKFSRYWGAYTTPGEWPDNQVVMFVAVDERRADELRWLRERLEPEQRLLFKVTTGAGLSAALA